MSFIYRIKATQRESKLKRKYLEKDQHTHPHPPHTQIQMHLSIEIFHFFVIHMAVDCVICIEFMTAYAFWSSIDFRDKYHLWPNEFQKTDEKKHYRQTSIHFYCNVNLTRRRKIDHRFRLSRSPLFRFVSNEHRPGCEPLNKPKN